MLTSLNSCNTKRRHKRGVLSNNTNLEFGLKLPYRLEGKYDELPYLDLQCKTNITSRAHRRFASTCLFSSPVRSPGRAIVLSPASVLASAALALAKC